ncbi:3-deoxy-8-phosphooctulonate synthase [Candidatus Sumerlaeota bacterium]|nr:3-deoxy-8-phosphooctulonate synthase [Candidatus Sumerlaeota bacterium]
MKNPVEIRSLRIGAGAPLALIAGPDVIESPDLAHSVAERLVEICGALGLPLIFKASFDKANRTSVDSFRGPGLERGLKTLAEIKRRHGVPILTDIHEPAQAAPAAEVADVLQVPAFLCRQTDLITAVARTGAVVNIKKGQFVAPPDMRHAAEKCRAAGNERVLLTERGFAFGYNNLVVDMRSIPWMQREVGCPVVFDATHSVQLPSAAAGQSGGTRDFIPHLARAAVAAGADAVFMEVHPDPDQALCDGAVSWRLDDLPTLLEGLLALRAALDAGQRQGD